jgi:phosphate transport system protein
MSPREEYVSQLQYVHDELLLIGSMVEKAIKRSIESLRNRDVELAHRIVEDDDDIDERYLALEELCIDLIATQQPMAGDLRVVITGMQVASELERMGDYAEGIAKVSIRMGDDPPLKPLIDIPRMADISIGMLRRSLTALNDRDDALARQVWHADDEVDQLYDQVFRELLTFMFQNPRNIQRATWLLWVAHNLERIGDRATNIAERVIYLNTGQIPSRDERWPDVGDPTSHDSGASPTNGSMSA